jgi:soluble lytic murein transglycosylase
VFRPMFLSGWILLFLAVPAVGEPGSCLAAGRSVPDCVSRQPDLSRIESDLAGLSGAAEPDLESSARTLLDRYDQENNARLHGLLCVWFGTRLMDTAPDRAVALLSDWSVHRHTALSELAVARILEILEKHPDLAPPLDPLFREICLLTDYPPELARRLFEVYRAGGRWDVAAAWLAAAPPEIPAAQSAWFAYARAEVDLQSALDESARRAAAGRFRALLLSPAGSDLWDRAWDRVLGLSGADPLQTAGLDERLALAERFTEKGDGERAGRCLQGALDQFRKRPSADPFWLLAGRAAYQRGDYTAARQFLERARPADKAGQASRLYLLALTSRRLNDRARFLQYLRQLGRLAPRSEEHLKLLPVAAFEAETAGKAGEARQYYERLVRNFDAGPAVAEAWWKLAWFDYAAGRIGSADRHFLAAFERDSGGEFGVAGLYWHGVCLNRLRRVGEAAACHRAVRDVFPYSYYAELIRQRPVVELRRIDAADPAAVAAWTAKLRSRYGKTDSAPLPWEQMLAPGDLAFVLETAAIGCGEETERRLQRAARETGRPELYVPLAELARQRRDTYWFIWYVNRACPELFMGEFAQFPQDVWRDLFPVKYEAMLRSHLQGSLVDLYLALALIRQESAFWETARSVSNAVGLMQLLPSTAAAEMGVRGDPARVVPQLENPAVNVELGCRYLLKMLHSLDDRIPLALAAYNGGARRVGATYQTYRRRLDMTAVIEMIPMAQSRNYVKSIYRNYNYYSRLYEGKPADIRAFLGDSP